MAADAIGIAPNLSTDLRAAHRDAADGRRALGDGRPVHFPLTTDDTATLEAVLVTGLSVDSADDENLTLLDWAVIANRGAVARMPIARGADVNHVDRFGMTPLQHAASIDFGNSEMIDLLRASGAKLDSQTKGGLLRVRRRYRSALR